MNINLNSSIINEDTENFDKLRKYHIRLEEFVKIQNLNLDFLKESEEKLNNTSVPLPVFLYLANNLNEMVIARIKDLQQELIL